MVINGNNIFLGAYKEIRQKPSTMEIDEKIKSLVTSKAQAAFEDMKKHRGAGVLVSLSQENKDFLCSESGYEKMKKDIEDLYIMNVNQQKEIAADKNKEDPFWENTGNQWMLISEYLYNNGFYSDMEENEVQQIENTLAKITAGMDHLSRIQYQTGIDFSDFYGQGSNYFMSSNEVVLELEASTSALKYFADKYVNSDSFEHFNQLIEQYHKHNSEVIEGYQNPHESFQKAVHDIHSRKHPDSFYESQLTVKPYNGFEHSIYLGGIRRTTHDKNEFQLSVHNFFENIRNDTNKCNSLWNQLVENYVNYTVNNADNDSLKAYVLDESKHTFKRINSYWSELLI